jgi:hypothetical protein
MFGDKSFADDLIVQRSIVSSRVAMLLRSAEIKLLLSDLYVHLHTLNRCWLMLAAVECGVCIVIYYIFLFYFVCRNSGLVWIEHFALSRQRPGKAG